ncbi:hypothetical protein [Microcella alkaliphila]|uniref:hypothetical protein n=1 Tax=Microcella alkaliphila TaxID=279828 RepID=UPI001028F447|nr:hypothetical protein [Microcella alkaliphila]
MKQLRKRVAELERPTGTQNAQAVAALQVAQAELQKTVDTLDGVIDLIARTQNTAGRGFSETFALTTTSTTLTSTVFTAPNYPCRVTFTASAIVAVFNNSGAADIAYSTIEYQVSGAATVNSQRAFAALGTSGFATLNTTINGSVVMPASATITFRVLGNSQVGPWSPAPGTNGAEVYYQAVVEPIIP